MIKTILKKIEEDEEVKKVLTQTELEELKKILISSKSEANKKSALLDILKGDNK